MLFRPAKIDADLEGIFAIYDDEVRNGTATFDTEPSTAETRERWGEHHREPRHAVLIAEDAGTIVGWASLSSYSERRAYARTAESSTYVHRDHRRRGIGKDLLVRLIDAARTAGLKGLLARITSESTGSLELHRVLGFQRVGTLHGVGEKFGRVLDVEIFELGIG